MNGRGTNDQTPADPTEAAFDRLRQDADALDPMAALRSYEERRSPSAVSTGPTRGWGWRLSLVAACLMVAIGASMYLRPARSPGVDTAGLTSTSTSTSTPTSTSTSTSTNEVDAVVEPDPTVETSEQETTQQITTERSNTASTLEANPDFPVRFFADNDDCGRTDDERSHPDWDPNPIEGQYPFANTEGEIGPAADWRFVESPLALSGDCVLSLTADTSGEADGAAQVSRVVDDDEFHLSTWLYFPSEIAFDRSRIVDGKEIFGFWQGIQINGIFNGDPGDTKSSAILTIGRLNDQQVMNAELFLTAPCGQQSDCPEGLSINSPNPQPVPVGQWVHFEIRMVIGDEDTGIVQIWQDGENIIEYRGNTELSGAEGHVWAIRNKGDLVTTGPSTVLVEDVLVSADAVHPLLFP